MTKSGQFCTLQLKKFLQMPGRKFMMLKIKNPKHGIRMQMVLKLTNKLKMVEIETDSRIDV